MTSAVFKKTCLLLFLFSFSLPYLYPEDTPKTEEKKRIPIERKRRSVDFGPSAYLCDKTIYVEFENNLSKASLSIIDESGQTILSEETLSATSITLSIASLTSGTYTLEISLSGEEYTGEFTID